MWGQGVALQGFKTEEARGGVLSRGGTWPVSGGCMEWTQEARDRGREDSAEAAAQPDPLDAQNWVMGS